MSHLEQRNFLSVFSTVVSTIFNTNKPMNLLSQVFADDSNTTNGTFPRPALRPAVVGEMGWPHSAALFGKALSCPWQQLPALPHARHAGLPARPARWPSLGRRVYSWERLETLQVPRGGTEPGSGRSGDLIFERSIYATDISIISSNRTDKLRWLLLHRKEAYEL